MAIKRSRESIIQRAIAAHNGFYSYDKFQYSGIFDKSIIICPIHGEFLQSANNHINHKQGCPGCKTDKHIKSRTKDINSFIEDATDVHGNSYSYDKFIYKKAYTKGIIVCPIHGDFNQTPSDHLFGKGCPKCGLDSRIILRTSNVAEFISKAKSIHGNRYIYDRFIYERSDIKGCILCPIHGEFLQAPNVHLSGNGCPKCNMSHGEAKIENILKSRDIKYISQHKFEDCKHIRMLPFDFFIPTFNLAIEYAGKQHFEAVDFFGGEVAFNALKNYDSIKDKYCSDNNIKLLRISYTDFNKISELLDAYLKIY